jgi:uncharacterized protein YjlB
MPWVWIIPALIVLGNLFTWRARDYMSYWTDVWYNFFSSHCGSSECLCELPLVAFRAKTR